MHFGELRGDGWLHGSDQPVKDGSDAHYAFPPGEKRWLVCSYGGEKRVKGTVINGHEWGQYMADGGREWWMQLDPKVAMCDLQVREIQSRDRGKSSWTVTAICERLP